MKEGQVAKQIWQVYNVYDFIDAKDNQSDWRVGFIIDKNPLTKYFKVRFDGWGSKYDEPYRFNSAKLADFRSIVVGYTGQKKNPAVRNDWKFTLKSHQQKVQMFKDYAESETKTAWEINQWFRGHNYLYVDFLMTETYNTLEQITAVMDYFLANVKLVINYLKNVDPEFKLYYRSQQIAQQSHLVNPAAAKANAFYELMDTLFTICGSYIRLESFFSKNAALLRKYLNIDFEKNVRRYYQLRILQQVMKEGGLQVIQQLINEKLQNSKCVIPFLFLKSLSALYIGLSNQIQYKDKKQYLNKIIQITKKNADKLDQKYLKDINKVHVSELLQTLRSAYENTQDEETVKVWALEQQIKFYEKLVSCPYFDKKLKGVVGFQELIQKNKMQPNAQKFIQILQRQKIFDSLFAADNAEIIRKSVQFCKTLYFNQMFPPNIAFRIWELRVGKHEAALQQIYSLISALPSKYNHSQFEKKLFEQISKIPKEQWDEDYIKMIKQYSLTAVGWVSTEDKQPLKYGFNILHQNVIAKKTDFAINSFIQLLGRFQKTQVMNQFIEESFMKIQHNEQAYTYITLLLKIIDENLSEFKQTSSKASSILVQDLLRNSNDSLQKNVKRLELLSHITKLTNTNVSYQQFMDLWNEFKNKPSQKALFDWIYCRKDRQKATLNQRIGSDIRKQIFEKVWPNNYDFSQISQKQAIIFIQFFKVTNVYQNRLKRLNVIIKTQNLNLKGFDKVWKAFQTIQDQKIAEIFAELIVEIHMCPTKIQEQQKQNWIKILISQFSRKILADYKQKDLSLVKRLLLIPYKIIERDEQIYSTKPGKNYIMKEYKVINITNKQEKFIKFNLGGLTYDFKKLVAEKFKIPFKKIKLSCKNELIKYENYFKSLVQCSFSNSPFQLQVISQDVPQMKKLLNTELQTFFTLLGDSELERNVWEIIEKLPIDQDFLAKLEDSKKPWQQINNPSIYKQLYIMRIMTYMSRKWWVDFCEGPGLSNLIKKFSRVTSKAKVQREYLKVLCQNIQKCLQFQTSLTEVNLQQLQLDMLKSLNEVLDNVSQQQSNKKHTVQISIVSSMFKIFKSLQEAVNLFKVLIEKFDDRLNLLSKGLITVKNQHIRKEFAFRLKYLSGIIPSENIQNYLNTIYKNIFELATTYLQSEQTSQYFQYAAALFDIINGEQIKKYFSLTDNLLVKEVQRGLYLQKSELNSESINYHLVGFLTLMKKLIGFCTIQQKQNITNFLLYKCFFPTSSDVDAICKCKESKTAALDLLASLIKQGEGDLKALQMLSGLHKNATWRTRKVDDWTLTPGQKVKSSSGYVGLKNLGCICYMNSFFQQIFMIPDFRQTILQCEDPFTQQNPLQNVLYQVKKMFFNLLYSEKKYYIPNQFCHSFKNYEGQPTNVFQQMDIDQFSGILFDRLQNQMKGTSYEHAIKDFFGGVFSNQIICKGCPHFSQTQQSFLNISLSVKSKKNIYQSFDAMIKGDTLDGDNAYFCERCNKKVPAVKRVCLKKLPDHLILTLKRFEFDFQTMNKMKLNDYCQFPIQLNVKQYSQQYLRKQQNPDRFDDDQIIPDSYYDYTLQGMVIHIGHADSGHYYSFIKERTDNGRWFQFNDTIVRPFDIKKLSEQAFGGQMGTIQVKQKIKNAYMLIYERKKKFVDHSKLIDQNKILTQIPIYAQLKQQIQIENSIQKIQNILFSTQYTKFAANLIKSVENMNKQTAEQVLKYIILVYLTVTIRQKEELSSFQFLKGLHKVLQQYPSVQEWVVIIFTAQSSLMQFFKNNPAKEVKKLLAHWVIELANQTSIQRKKTLVDGLLAFIINHNENSSEFCEILFHLMSHEEICLYAINKNMAGILLQNILGVQHPTFKNVHELCIVETAEDQIGKQVIIERSNYQLNKKVKVHQQYPYVWGILQKLVLYAETKGSNLKNLLFSQQMQLLYLPTTKVYKILQQCKNKFMINKLCKLLSHLATNNKKYSEQLLDTAFEGLKLLQSKKYRQLFILISKLMKINDEFKQYRLRKGLQCMLKALKHNEKYNQDSNIIQQWIMKIVRKNKKLQQIINEDTESLKYLLQLPGKKQPTDETCRKNTVFQQTTVNKFHGIRMFRNKKAYEHLAKKMQKFYMDIAEENPIEVDEWQSDEDLTQQTIKIGQTVAYFDGKEKLQFVEGKVEQILLSRLWISVNKTKMPGIWQDDERLTSKKFPFEEIESDDELVDSQNTTEMEYEEDPFI